MGRGCGKDMEGADGRMGRDCGKDGEGADVRMGRGLWEGWGGG